MNNNLPWSPNTGTREHYVAVGQSFSQGFSAGFFLCFFLTLAAYVIGTHVERKRRAMGRAASGATVMLNHETAGES